MPTLTASPVVAQMVQAGAGGEVFVHRDEGELSRVRKGDAV
jgi:hypothetical protein